MVVAVRVVRQKPGHDPGSLPCILTADGLRVWLCVIAAATG